MPKKFKGENTKVAAANERKAASAATKASKSQVEKERADEEKWSKGAKDDSRKVESQAKKDEAAKKKAEKARLLAEEEASLPSKPVLRQSAPKGAEKTALKKQQKVDEASKAHEKVEEFGARNIEDAIDLLSLGNSPSSAIVTNKAGPSVATGGATGVLDRHPERRFKAALASYEERELPRIKAENPGLRLMQLKQVVYKEFQKSPENPFNQTMIGYDATKEDMRTVTAQRKAELESRLKE